LVRALSGMGGEEFDSAKGLNAIRNALAHRADVTDLPARIDTVLRRHNGEVPRKLTRRQRVAWLRGQLAFVCGALRGIADGFHVATRV